MAQQFLPGDRESPDYERDNRNRPDVSLATPGFLFLIEGLDPEIRI
jgi:hypothetical protein